MNDWKTLMREVLFGVDYNKCGLVYDLYLSQLGLQLSLMEPIFTEHNITKHQAHTMLAKYNILGLLPFVHCMRLYLQRVISKRELVAILFHMCDKTSQPPSLVYNIFAHIDDNISTTLIDAAATLESGQFKTYVDEHGIIPVLISQYNQVVTTNGNIYANMVDIIIELEQLNGV